MRVPMSPSKLPMLQEQGKGRQTALSKQVAPCRHCQQGLNSSWARVAARHCFTVDSGASAAVSRAQRHSPKLDCSEGGAEGAMADLKTHAKVCSRLAIG